MITLLVIFIFILFLILALLERRPHKKYNMCIMAIFKNEEPYLEEWLKHHIKVGFHHFYLYSNDPNLEKYNYLDKYKDYITIIDWTDKQNDGNKLYNSIQRQAYYHCVNTFKKECRYLMMLDIDEFVYPSSYTSDLFRYVRDDVKAIKLQRYNFGSGGHLTKPKGNVVDNYKTREKICSSYKTLINTDYLDESLKFYGVHDFNYINKPGKVYNSYLDYNDWGFPSGCNSRDSNEVPYVINHYSIKSKEEYIARCKLWENGGVNPVSHRKDCDNSFEQNDISLNKNVTSTTTS